MKTPTWQEVRKASWGGSASYVWVRVSTEPELWQHELIMDVHFARTGSRQDTCMASVTGGHGPVHISLLSFDEPPVHRQARSWGEVCRFVQFYRMFNSHEVNPANS